MCWHAPKSGSPLQCCEDKKQRPALRIALCEFFVSEPSTLLCRPPLQSEAVEMAYMVADRKPDPVERLFDQRPNYRDPQQILFNIKEVSMLSQPSPRRLHAIKIAELLRYHCLRES